MANANYNRIGLTRWRSVQGRLRNRRQGEPPTTSSTATCACRNADAQQRQTCDEPARQAIRCRSHGNAVEPFNLGEVELGPGSGVLPPPEHTCLVLQDEIVAAALRILVEKALQNGGSAVAQGQDQIAASSFISDDALRSDLQVDDRGLIERERFDTGIDNCATILGNNLYLLHLLN
ncbi:hypothetical protein V9K97_03795 [Variovorax sp. CCNWLW186]